MHSTVIPDEKETLRLLLDIARTLDKHVELRSSLGPLFSLLEVRAGLVRGMVTLLERSTGVLKIEEANGLSADEKGRGTYALGRGSSVACSKLDFLWWCRTSPRNLDF